MWWWQVAFSCFLLSNFIESLKKDDEDPCSVCRTIVFNYEKGLSETASQNFEGGSSTWEKDRNIKFEKSETRLNHILDHLCDDVTRNDLCVDILDKHEDLISDWFLNAKEDLNLLDILCIEASKVCCPSNHFGKDCEPCKVVADNVICNDHGTCDGDGTRQGTGECNCRRGFTGPLCLECTVGSYQNDTECFPCDRSCNGTCVNGTVEGCEGSCNSGWVTSETSVCQDVDECATKQANCSSNQFCVNVPGKFYCNDCHESCGTCNGYGDSKCLSCKPGYGKPKEGKCEEINECEDGTHTCKPGKYCVNKPGGYSCKKCDKACKTTCTGPDPEHCVDCTEGYSEVIDGMGCTDVDECENYPNRCPDGKYCVNKKGSYKCKKCDESCELCHGPGPYSCLSCSENYNLTDGVCIHESKKPKEHQKDL